MPGAKKVITLSVSAALIASMFGIAGCGYRDNGNGVRTQNIRYGVTDTNRINRFGVNSTDMRNRLNPNVVGTRNLDNLSPNVVGTRNFDNMRYSAVLSRRISEMKGIRNATVLVNDNSAYVALSQEGQRGTNATMRERTTDMGNMGIRGTVGTRAPYTTGGIAPGLTGNNYGLVPRGSIADNNRLYGTSGTGTTALPSHVRNKVANKVKQYAPHIQHVYVSNDPDFVTRMGGYARDLGNGLPFSGMRNDFRTLADRLFPAGTIGLDGVGPRPGTINRGNSTISGNR